MSYYVYWVHLPNQTDIATEGYVGVTNNLENRWRQHRSSSSGCPHFKNAISKYGAQLIWEEVFVGTREGALQLEAYWRSAVSIGWNLQAGGIATHHTPETIKQISDKNRGQKRSKEVVEKMRETSKQVWAVHRDKMLKAVVAVGKGCKGRVSPMKGRTHSNETKVKVSGLNNVKSKKANVYEAATGNIIAKEVALGQWARDNNIQASHLTATARGERKTTGGYFAKYTGLSNN